MQCHVSSGPVQTLSGCLHDSPKATGALRVIAQTPIHVLEAPQSVELVKHMCMSPGQVGPFGPRLAEICPASAEFDRVRPILPCLAQHSACIPRCSTGDVPARHLSDVAYVHKSAAECEPIDSNPARDE